MQYESNYVYEIKQLLFNLPKDQVGYLGVVWGWSDFAGQLEWHAVLVGP